MLALINVTLVMAHTAILSLAAILTLLIFPQLLGYFISMLLQYILSHHAANSTIVIAAISLFSISRIEFSIKQLDVGLRQTLSFCLTIGAVKIKRGKNQSFAICLDAITVNFYTDDVISDQSVPPIRCQTHDISQSRRKAPHWLQGVLHTLLVLIEIKLSSIKVRAKHNDLVIETCIQDVEARLTKSLEISLQCSGLLTHIPLLCSRRALIDVRPFNVLATMKLDSRVVIRKLMVDSEAIYINISPAILRLFDISKSLIRVDTSIHNVPNHHMNQHILKLPQRISFCIGIIGIRPQTNTHNESSIELLIDNFNILCDLSRIHSSLNNHESVMLTTFSTSITSSTLRLRRVLHEHNALSVNEINVDVTASANILLAKDNFATATTSISCVGLRVRIDDWLCGVIDDIARLIHTASSFVTVTASSHSSSSSLRLKLSAKLIDSSVIFLRCVDTLLFSVSLREMMLSLSSPQLFHIYIVDVAGDIPQASICDSTTNSLNKKSKSFSSSFITIDSANMQINLTAKRNEIDMIVSGVIAQLNETIVDIIEPTFILITHAIRSVPLIPSSELLLRLSLLDVRLDALHYLEFNQPQCIDNWSDDRRVLSVCIREGGMTLHEQGLNQTWKVELLSVKVYHDSQPSSAFLCVEYVALDGAECSATDPKRLHVVGKDIVGNCDPLIFLSIFKFIKDIVAAVITLKALFYNILYQEYEASFQRRLHGLDIEALCPSCDPSLLFESNHIPSSFRFNSQAITHFRRWCHNHRAHYLCEQFLLVSLHATNVFVSINVTHDVCFDMKVNIFSSQWIPFHWIFDGVECVCNQQPLLTISKLEVSRAGVITTPKPIYQQPSFTEESQNIMEYADIEVKGKGLQVEIASSLMVNEIIPELNLHLRALVNAVNALPSLDSLSKRRGGMGYFAPPCLPSPSLQLAIDDVSFDIIDTPLEAWLQCVSPLWIDESIMQNSRHELLNMKVREWQRENKRILPQQKLNDLLTRLSETNFKLYKQRLTDITSENCKKYSDSDTLHSSLKRGAMLHIHLSTLNVSTSLSGKYGVILSSLDALRCLRVLDDDDRKQKDINIENLAIAFGTYIDIAIKDLCVQLRQFPLALCKIHSISFNGCVVITQQYSSSAHSVMDYVSLSDSHALICLVRRPLTPFKFFFDIGGQIHTLLASYSPRFDWTLQDIMKIFITKFCPSMLDASKPLTLFDAMRYFFHGRAKITLENWMIHIYASLHPSTIHRFIKLGGDRLSVEAKGFEFAVGIDALIVKMCHQTPTSQSSNDTTPTVQLFSVSSSPSKFGRREDCIHNHSVEFEADVLASISSVVVCAVVTVFNGDNESRVSHWLHPLVTVADNVNIQHINIHSHNDSSDTFSSFRGKSFSIQCSLATSGETSISVSMTIMPLVIAFIDSFHTSLLPSRKNIIYQPTFSCITEMLHKFELTSVIISPFSFTIFEYDAQFEPVQGIRLSIAQLQLQFSLLSKNAFFSGELRILLGSKRFALQAFSLQILDINASLVGNAAWWDRAKARGANGVEPLLHQVDTGQVVVVHTFENQRYVLGQGWKAKLLPTDRPNWSDIQGLTYLPRNHDAFALPSSEWSWSDDWHVDFCLRAANQVDVNGWEYAHDFPRRFHPLQIWTDNVRRRRWIRVRRLRGCVEAPSRFRRIIDDLPQLSGLLLDCRRITCAQDSLLGPVTPLSSTLFDNHSLHNANSHSPRDACGEMLNFFEIAARSQEVTVSPSLSASVNDTFDISNHTTQTHDHPDHRARIIVDQLRLRLTLDARNSLVHLASVFINCLAQELGSEVKKMLERQKKCMSTSNPDTDSIAESTIINNNKLKLSHLHHLHHLHHHHHHQTEYGLSYLREDSALSSLVTLKPDEVMVESNSEDEVEHDDEFEAEDDEDEDNENEAILAKHDKTSIIDKEQHDCVNMLDLITIEFITPQFNLESIDARGCVVFWLKSCLFTSRAFLSDQYEHTPCISSLECRILMSSVQAFVAPTDVDVDSKVVWYDENAPKVFKCIMFPAQLQACITLYKANVLHQIDEYWVMAMSDTIAPIINKRIGSASNDSITLLLPNIDIELDSSQLHLLLQVFQATIMQPLPASTFSSHDEQQYVYAARLEVDPERHAMLLWRARARQRWQIRHIEWLLSVCAPEQKETLPSARSEISLLQSHLHKLILQHQNMSSSLAGLLMLCRRRLKSSLPNRSISNITLQLSLDSVSLRCMKNGQSFLRASLSGICSHITFCHDLSGKVAFEIRDVDVRNEIMAHKEKAKDICWAEMLVPMHTYNAAGERCTMDTFDRRVVFTLQAQHKKVGGIHVIPHLEANLAHLSVRITSDIIDEIIDFLAPKTSKRKSRHLVPLSTGILGSDSSQRHRMSAADTAKERILQQESDQDIHKNTQSNQSLFSESVQLSNLQSDVNLMAARSKANISFTYIRLGTVRVTISFSGRANHSIADFQNLSIRIKRLIYHKKTWTLIKFLDRLKRDITRAALLQVGDGLAGYLRYKFGFSSGFTVHPSHGYGKRVKQSMSSLTGIEMKPSVQRIDGDVVSLDCGVDGSAVYTPIEKKNIKHLRSTFSMRKKVKKIFRRHKASSGRRRSLLLGSRKPSSRTNDVVVAETNPSKINLKSSTQIVDTFVSEAEYADVDDDDDDESVDDEDEHIECNDDGNDSGCDDDIDDAECVDEDIDDAECDDEDIDDTECDDEGIHEVECNNVDDQHQNEKNDMNDVNNASEKSNI